MLSDLEKEATTTLKTIEEISVVTHQLLLLGPREAAQVSSLPPSE